MFCYYLNRFLTVSNKTPIFKEKIVPKMQFLAQTPPPWFLVQVFVRSQTKITTASSIIWSTYNYTQSMIEGFVWPFPILLNP